MTYSSMIDWRELVQEKYLSLIEGNTENDAKRLFDLDIRAGFFSIVREEKKHLIPLYIKENIYKPIHFRTQIQLLSLWWDRLTKTEFNEESEVVCQTSEAFSIRIDGDRPIVTFKCVTGEIITRSKFVHVKIDNSLGDRCLVSYPHPEIHLSSKIKMGWAGYNGEDSVPDGKYSRRNIVAL